MKKFIIATAITVSLVLTYNAQAQPFLFPNAKLEDSLEQNETARRQWTQQQQTNEIYNNMQRPYYRQQPAFNNTIDAIERGKRDRREQELHEQQMKLYRKLLKD